MMMTLVMIMMMMVMLVTMMMMTMVMIMMMICYHVITLKGGKRRDIFKDLNIINQVRTCSNDCEDR